MNICTKCGEPCEVLTLEGYEKDEFWGAPCRRPVYEEVSECCDAEVEEVCES